MAANSTQGMGTLVFLVAFTALACGLFSGSVICDLLFLLGLGASVMLFIKAKGIEATE